MVHVTREWRRIHDEEFWAIKSRRIIWVGHIARMGERRGVYKVLVGKPEGKRPLGSRGELSYLAPLGSENISAPYFKQCFFRGGGYYPPD